MNLNEALPTGAIESLASKLGISPDQAQRGAHALLPAILGGMKQHAQRNGAQPLASKIEALGGSQLAHNVIKPQPTDTGLGDQILEQIFGSKDTSRTVAQQASRTTGLGPELLKKMLPMLAMLVAGHLSQKSGGQPGGLGGVLESALGRELEGAGAGGGLGGMLGSFLGGKS